MFPLYDTVRSRRFPLINLMLILVNVLAFLYEMQMDPSVLKEFIFEWGLIPVRLLNGPAAAWSTIFTSMFLHGGWFHIINNMWVLFIFGDNVEARMGGIRYLFFYLFCGVAAGLFQTYVLSSSQQPMIGASGAVAGVLGAYLILFPHSRIASLVPILFIFTIIEIPALIFPALLVRIAVVFGVVRDSGRGRKWNCMVGSYWRFFIRRPYGVFL